MTTSKLNIWINCMDLLSLNYLIVFQFNFDGKRNNWYETQFTSNGKSILFRIWNAKKKKRKKRLNGFGTRVWCVVQKKIVQSSHTDIRYTFGKRTIPFWTLRIRHFHHLHLCELIRFIVSSKYFSFSFSHLNLECAEYFRIDSLQFLCPIWFGWTKLVFIFLPRLQNAICNTSITCFNGPDQMGIVLHINSH